MLCEACWSIEEMAAQDDPVASHGASNGVPRSDQLFPCETAVTRFEWWMTIADQLTGMMLNQWADFVLRSSQCCHY
jgi:hypothetical protein